MLCLRTGLAGMGRLPCTCPPRRRAARVYGGSFFRNFSPGSRLALWAVSEEEMLSCEGAGQAPRQTPPRPARPKAPGRPACSCFKSGVTSDIFSIKEKNTALPLYPPGASALPPFSPLLLMTI